MNKNHDNKTCRESAQASDQQPLELSCAELEKLVGGRLIRDDADSDGMMLRQADTPNGTGVCLPDATSPLTLTADGPCRF